MILQNFGRQFLILASTLSFAVAASAKSKTKELTVAEFDKVLENPTYTYENAPSEVTTLNEAEILKVIREQEKRRKPAQESLQSAEFYEGKMSAEFKGIRDRFLKIQSGAELDKALSEYEQLYQANKLEEVDSRFFVAQILPLRSMRGIVWRLKPLVADHRMAHSMLLTMTKNVVVNTNIFFPTNQSKALTEYLTQPFIEDGILPWKNKDDVVKAFKASSAGGEAELQAYFIRVVIPMLKIAASRVAESRNTLDKEIVFDNRIWYGGNSFPDARDRYALVGETERQVALSVIYANISELSFQSAYSWKGTLAMNSDIGKRYGYDTLDFEIDGVPLEKRVKEIRRYSDWGVLKYPNNIKEDAWTFLVASVAAADKAWEGMKARPANEMYVVDTSTALPFQRYGDLRMKNSKGLLAGQRAITSSITGDSVEVDLKSFYANPPQDLKSLYPVPGGFIKGKQLRNISLKNSKGATINQSYRDYTIGSGSLWDVSKDSPYKTLFPQVKDGGKDFLRHVRVLSQSWGSSAVAIPIMTYIQ